MRLGSEPADVLLRHHRLRIMHTVFLMSTPARARFSNRYRLEERVGQGQRGTLDPGWKSAG